MPQVRNGCRDADRNETIAGCEGVGLYAANGVGYLESHKPGAVFESPGANNVCSRGPCQRSKVDT